MEENSAVMKFLMSAAVSVLTENTVFTRAFGVSTAVAAAKSPRNLAGTALGVTYFTFVSSAAVCILPELPLPESIAYLAALFQPLRFVIIIGGIYAVTLMLLRIFTGRFFARIKKYIHISAFNSAVMGTVYLCGTHCQNTGEYLLFGLFSGLGFALAACMLSGVYDRLCSDNVPGSFRGFPAVMIWLGIISMAVWGILGRTAV